MGVSIWAFKNVPLLVAYPLTAQPGSAARKRFQADRLTGLVQLIPQIPITPGETQGR